MKIIRAKDYQDMSRKAANIISAQVIMKPDCVLGLATGGTPVGTYAQLVDWYNKGDLDFSEVTTVNLDEYRGLPKEHPQSYWYFMNENLFSKVNIDPAKTNLPDGTNLDTAASVPVTTVSSTSWAASTCSCWASAPMVISASMSRAKPLSWRPTASTLRPLPSKPTSASLTATRPLSPNRHTPWASRPSCRHARCWW